MKRSVVVALLVLALTASLGSAAAALDGKVYVGLTVHGSTSDHTYQVAAVSLQLTDRFAVGVGAALGEEEVNVEVHYGRGKGVYAGTYVVSSGSIEDWYAGLFFDHAVSSVFELRTHLGVYGFTADGIIVPEAWVQASYDLAGPFALLGELGWDWLFAGLAYEF